MTSFPMQSKYLAGYTKEYASEQFIRKVAMSSEIPKRSTNITFLNHHASRLPVVMVVYHHQGVLGFARLGDKVWTDVKGSSHGLEDIVYHKGKFYAVDFRGNVYIYYEEREWPRGTKIASIETKFNEQKYLVQSLSGSGLLLVVRARDELLKRARVRASKYRTTNFDVWRLELDYRNSFRIPSCTLTRVNNLGDEAIFIGRASSLSVPSSDIIRPNSIYFTDDHQDVYIHLGGGHDMGIFDIEHRRIEPHYQGKSIHCISPPLWYI